MKPPQPKPEPTAEGVLSTRADFNKAARVRFPRATTDRAVWDQEFRAYRVRQRTRVEGLLESARLAGEAKRCAESVLRVIDSEREREDW